MNISLDKNISKNSLKEMIACFKPEFKDYHSGETVMEFSAGIKKIGILLKGKARLMGINADGEYIVSENYSSRDVFGELFSFPLEGYDYFVEAVEDCKVIYLDYNHTISPCDNVCPHHSQLISNLFYLTAQKSQALTLHLSILNQHSIRKKLLTYLKYIQGQTGKDTFTLPMSLVDLAKYLCVDRSALMREIRQLKKEGLLTSNRRQFTFL